MSHVSDGVQEEFRESDGERSEVWATGMELGAGDRTNLAAKAKWSGNKNASGGAGTLGTPKHAHTHTHTHTRDSDCGGNSRHSSGV